MKTTNLLPSSAISSKPKSFGRKLFGMLLLLVSFGFSATIEVKCTPKNLKKFNGTFETYVSSVETDEDGKSFSVNELKDSHRGEDDYKISVNILIVFDKEGDKHSWIFKEYDGLLDNALKEDEEIDSYLRLNVPSILYNSGFSESISYNGEQVAKNSCSFKVRNLDK